MEDQEAGKSRQECPLITIQIKNNAKVLNLK